jgi:RIO-like serine/threonine protein kinase
MLHSSQGNKATKSEQRISRNGMAVSFILPNLLHLVRAHVVHADNQAFAVLIEQALKASKVEPVTENEP